MNLQNNTYKLIIGGLIIAVVILFISYLRKPTTINVPQIDTVKTVQYIQKPVYVTTLKAKLDTLILESVKSDTVYKEVIITASADTLLVKDSSYIKVKYHFPPANYFDIDAQIKERQTTLTITKEKPETFWDRFGYGLQAGFGTGLINKNFDIYFGIGVHFRIK